MRNDGKMPSIFGGLMPSLSVENAALALEYLALGVLVSAVIMIVYWPEVV